MCSASGAPSACVSTRPPRKCRCDCNAESRRGVSGTCLSRLPLVAVTWPRQSFRATRTCCFVGHRAEVRAQAVATALTGLIEHAGRLLA